jgi:hypothetical protein
MTELETNLHNRNWLVERLRAEIIGPDAPSADIAITLDDAAELNFETWTEFRKPKLQRNGEEVLWQDPPTKRYGAGILFPAGITEERQAASSEDTDALEVSTESSSDETDPLPEETEVKDPSKTKIIADESENYDVTLANAHRPSAMGLSYLVDLRREPKGMEVKVRAAEYDPIKVHIKASDTNRPDSERTIWLRKPLTHEGVQHLVVSVPSEDLLKAVPKLTFWLPGQDNRLQIVVVSRPYGSETDTQRRLVTVSLVNKQERNAGRVDELSYYQCEINISGLSAQPWIAPYPEVERTATGPLDEIRVNQLLYRDLPTYATGHGCAACWERQELPKGKDRAVKEIWTDCLPTCETPSTNSNVLDSANQPIRVSMRKLAGLDPGDDGFNDIKRLVESYGQWIDRLEEMDDPHELIKHVTRSPIPIDLRDTATALIERCRVCLRRINGGIAFLEGTSEIAHNARTAFRLANEAMLISQLRSSRTVRHPHWTNDGKIEWEETPPNIDPAAFHADVGYWRPFQIAFLLMSIEGICLLEHADRQTVDLIWFPTGGGKTEAYLGLTAFTVLYHRIAGQEPGGADVIMRYTLRMLTSQQFQRAALLFCALEHIRRNPGNLPFLGTKEFRLGMWIGGDATPNKRADAVKKLTALQKDPKDAENPFVLLKCPWCNALFGPLKDEDDTDAPDHETKKAHRKPPRNTVLGYRETRVARRSVNTVIFRCSDFHCEFGKDDTSLPITVIDEEIYERTPNMLICTVDKFALLAWKPEIRAIFGITSEGERRGCPPSLIIQDELHLISGPLGSIVGAYETVIESLCTVTLNGKKIKPKIVASTATVSRAADQIKALYARQSVEIFPPSGLETGDSYFARHARSADGRLLPGRMYAGVLAPAHGSLQTTEARIFAALLQYPAIMPVVTPDGVERDPWWTLLCFFNSLRELGGAATLFVADARDYLRVIIDRHGLNYQHIRQLLNWEELTSRVRGDHIPRAIQRLEVPYRKTGDGHSRDTVEACLASNIIEVGVDIDRLSLMAVIGQPKTNSQYIQVTGRVGRKAVAPGMVVVAFSSAKPRDRSHYEQFQAYHQRMYAEVEPTSVTPFSPPAVDRTLHALIVAYVRQQMNSAASSKPRPCPVPQSSAVRGAIGAMIRNRVAEVDPEEMQHTEDVLRRRIAEWQAWDPGSYGEFRTLPADPTLLHPAGTTTPDEWNNHSWPTLTSLRNVDATCEATITGLYNQVPNTGENL